MKKKMGIVLLLCIILIGAGISYYNSQSKEAMGQTVEEEEVTQKICSLEGNVRRIEIKNTQTTVLERQDQEWFNSAYKDLKYDWSSVHSWLSDLRSMESKEIIHKVQDESIYGIDEQSVTITLYDEMNNSQIFKVGKSIQDKDLLYVATDRMQGVYGVAINAQEKFLKDPNSFVIAQLNAPSVDEIQDITFDLKGEKSVGLKKVNDLGHDKWYLVDYYKGSYGVQSEVLENILEILRGMKAESFAGIITDTQDYGLSKPQVVITLNNEWSLSLSKMEGNRVYGRVNQKPYAYAINKEVLEQLVSLKPFSMIKKEVLEMTLQGNKEIILENPQGKYTLSLKDKNEGQIATQPIGYLNNKELTKEQISELMTVLNSSIWIEAALQNPEIEQKEERKAEITITCKMTNGQEDKIELIPYDINYYILRTNGEIEFAVNKDKATKLFSTLHHMTK